MISIDDQQKVVHVLFKESIIGPLKFKMADLRHLENRESVIFSKRKNHLIFMKFGTYGTR